MRLNKYISSTGICSRREADRWISEGRVKVNGKAPELGQDVTDSDTVKVDGKLLKKAPEKIYLALNKPVGIICTTEKHVRGNVIDFIGHEERIFPIGRLDKDSEGLILLTNDGDIVNELLREENKKEKEYYVTVDKAISSKVLSQLEQGVRIFNPVKKKYTTTKSCKVDRIDEYSFKMVLSQGLNRQIRRMCSHFGYEVTKLRRVRIGSLRIGKLPMGHWRYLSPDEVEELRNS